MQNNNNMNGGQLGGLPLIPRSRFQALGNEYWSSRGANHWEAPSDLVRLQRLLREKRHTRVDEDNGSGDDHDDDVEREESLVLVSKYTKPSVFYRREYTRNPKIPYHPDILPRWTAFADSYNNESPSLDRLQIDNIVIPPPPFFKQKFLPILKNSNDGLMSLELHNCDLGADDISCIAQFMKKNKSLSTLDLSGNKIDNLAAAKSLAAAMKKNKELSFVNLSKCGLGENDDVLSAVLGGCKGLKSLLLEGNGINTEGAVVILSKFLTNNKALTLLSLKGNSIGGDKKKMEAFDKALTKNTKLREVSLDSVNITVPTFLKNGNTFLTHLDLSGRGYPIQNTIKAPGAKIIAKYLKKNPALVELNLAWNRIPSVSAKELASALKHNTNLEHLDLKGNTITDKAVSDLVDGLKNNTTLLTLDLCFNNIKVETGRKQLIRGALCDTASLQTIANSNHTCKVLLVEDGKKYRNDITHEYELKNINTLDESEGMKIRYKVVLSMFKLNQDLFHPRSFDDIPLELMPRLLELCQQELGFGGYGKGIVERTKKMSSKNTLRRIYQAFTEWNIPLLVMVSCF